MAWLDGGDVAADRMPIVASAVRKLFIRPFDGGRMRCTWAGSRRAFRDEVRGPPAVT
ncbi:MAG TPA: hypothetical protein VFY92_09375 [Hyphomicrobiaceae bacterium]|nr:hypothetical protein [Hyphomicrobiaceae bacterium]